MIGIESTDAEFLEGINTRIHDALKEAPVDYVADRYAELLSDGDLYALVILQIPVHWYPVIMETLTPEERDMIQTLDPSWGRIMRER